MEAPVAGLSMIVASGLLLPPVRNYVYSNTNKKIPPIFRVISIFVLLLTFGYFIGQVQDKKAQDLAVHQAQEKAQKEAHLRQEIIDQFNDDREQIINSAKNALSEKDYQSAISQTNKFLVVGNEEINEINAKANKELIAIENTKKTESLLTELKTVPEKDYRKNLNLYTRLLDLHPNNESYKTQVTYYTDKLAEEEKKQKADESRKKKIEAQFSKWNGSHRNLEKIIKKSMNDPDSFDHVETKYWDSGDYLVVQTTFRGKNAFGGVVVNSMKAKVGLDGQILDIIDR